MDDRVEPAGERVRLVDVALACGVTKSVASRALNGDPSLTIRPATRLRILAAARELGYRPHAGARALAGARTRALALLIPDLSNPVYSRIVRGAYRRARERGYVMLLVEDTPTDGADETFADLVEEGRVDGLLIASARPDHRLLASARLDRLPHVFVNREMPGSGRNVGMDLAEASATAVRHLYALGHTDIGLVSGPAELYPARVREQGFRDQMTGLGLDPDCCVSAPFSEEGGRRRPAGCWPANRHPPRSTAARSARPSAPCTPCTSSACVSPRTSPSSPTMICPWPTTSAHP